MNDHGGIIYVYTCLGSVNEEVFMLEKCMLLFNGNSDRQCIQKELMHTIIHYIPPYSLDLNPWKSAFQKLLRGHNEVCDNIEEFVVAGFFYSYSR